MGEVLTQTTKRSKTKIEYTKSNFILHSFRSEILDQKIMFQVIKMQGSVYIWIGDLNKPVLVNLALAMHNKYDTLPAATILFGDMMESTSKSIACKLNKKLNKIVYVSYNLMENLMEIPLVEKRLMEEMKNHPDKF